MKSIKKQNVLIAADYSSGCSGNFIASLVELLNAITALNRKVVFVFPKNENTTSPTSWVKWLEREGGTVRLLDKNADEDIQLAFLNKLIAENSIGILHLHFGLFHHLAIYNRKELPVKVIIHEHMTYPMGCNTLKQTMVYFSHSVLYRMKKITIVSVCKRVYDAHLFCKRYYIPNGLSFMRNISCSLSREERRKMLNLSEDEKIVLLLGWDYRRKGIDIAVSAVSECRKRGHNIILGTIGVDLSDENVEKFILKETGISTKEKWIRSLPGVEDMFSYHRAIDVYLSASKSEAFSYGILETISQNTPVVLSDIIDTRWCIKYSKAFSYPVENYQKCADAIEKAIKAGRKESNYKDIIEEFSIGNWCERVIDVYNNV